MEKYISRAVQVEAVKLLANSVSIWDALKFVGDPIVEGAHTVTNPSEEFKALVDEALEKGGIKIYAKRGSGWTCAMFDEYIVKGIAGTYYACDVESFKQSHFIWTNGDIK